MSLKFETSTRSLFGKALDAVRPSDKGLARMQQVSEAFKRDPKDALNRLLFPNQYINVQSYRDLNQFSAKESFSTNGHTIEVPQSVAIALRGPVSLAMQETALATSQRDSIRLDFFEGEVVNALEAPIAQKELSGHVTQAISESPEKKALKSGKVAVVSEFSDPTLSPDELLNKADVALENLDMNWKSELARGLEQRQAIVAEKPQVVDAIDGRSSKQILALAEIALLNTDQDWRDRSEPGSSYQELEQAENLLQSWEAKKSDLGLLTEQLSKVSLVVDYKENVESVTDLAVEEFIETPVEVEARPEHLGMLTSTADTRNDNFTKIKLRAFPVKRNVPTKKVEEISEAAINTTPQVAKVDQRAVSATETPATKLSVIIPVPHETSIVTSETLLVREDGGEFYGVFDTENKISAQVLSNLRSQYGGHQESGATRYVAMEKTLAEIIGSDEFNSQNKPSFGIAGVSSKSVIVGLYGDMDVMCESGKGFISLGSPSKSNEASRTFELKYRSIGGKRLYIVPRKLQELFAKYPQEYEHLINDNSKAPKAAIVEIKSISKRLDPDSDFNISVIDVDQNRVEGLVRRKGIYSPEPRLSVSEAVGMLIPENLGEKLVPSFLRTLKRPSIPRPIKRIAGASGLALLFLVSFNSKTDADRAASTSQIVIPAKPIDSAQSQGEFRPSVSDSRDVEFQNAKRKDEESSSFWGLSKSKIKNLKSYPQK